VRESSSIKRNSRGVMKVKSGPDEGAARGDAVSIQIRTAWTTDHRAERAGAVACSVVIRRFDP